MPSRMGAWRGRLSLRDRSAAIVLTFALHILILLLLLWLTPDMLPFHDEDVALSTFNLPAEKSGNQSAALASRIMGLQCTIQEGQIWIGSGERTAHLEPVVLHRLG